MDKAYQILIVNKTCGLNAIIPDRYCYNNIEEALIDVKKREQAFVQGREPFEYKGIIHGLGDISKIYKDHNLAVDTNECYIYELDLKTKFDGQ